MPKRKITKPSPRSKKKSRKISLLTKALFLSGIILILIPSIFYLNETIQLTFFTPRVTHERTSNEPRPINITIPAVNIDLPIIDTALSGNTWQIADNGVSHLAISGRPGESTTDILYAHNTNDRFGPIRWLSVGQTLQLTTADKKVHSYTIVQTLQVDPTATKILVDQKGETLILYTCAGFADLQRFIVIAKPKR